jgi:hypothetical protein
VQSLADVAPQQSSVFNNMTGRFGPVGDHRFQ